MMRFCLILILINFFWPPQTWALCPLCVATTGAGVGFFRWLGVDDTIVGLWLGGFIASVSIWLSKKANRQLFIVLTSAYLLNLFLFHRMGLLGSSANKLWGVNKSILGMTIGSLLAFLTAFLDKFLRDKNQGKVFVSYQKILISLSLLFIFSLILYTITRGA